MQTVTSLHVHKLKKVSFIYARNHQKLSLYSSSQYLPDKRYRVWPHAASRGSSHTATYCFPCASNLAQISSPCRACCTLLLLFHGPAGSIMDKASTDLDTTEIALWQEVACHHSTDGHSRRRTCPRTVDDASTDVRPLRCKQQTH